MSQEWGGNTNSGIALVHVDPVVDEKVRALGLEVITIVQEAEHYIIASDADVHGAAPIIAFIIGLQKAFEEKRKEYTTPLNDYLKVINEAFKKYTDPLDQAERSLKGKVIAFDNERKAINRAREEANRLNKEAAQREMRLTGELSEPVGLMEIAPAPPAHYRSVAGDLGKATIRKWEVVDFALLPDRFKMENAALIGKVVRAGIPSIPGIRIYEQEILRVVTPKG